MMRLIATAVIAFVSNAIGLIVAANVLADVGVGASGFVIAVAIFTGVSVLIEPLLRQTVMKKMPALLGSTALITVLISLIITTIVGNSLTIDGLTNWVLATVIVWAASFAGRLLLPLVIFKKTIAAAKAN